MKKLFSALLLCLFLCAGAAAEDLTIVHVTDVHYLSPALTDYGEGFMQVVESADGKVTHYTPQLMHAFVDEMLALQPNAVILSGDLTFNGAMQSHKDLSALLQPLADSGVRVLALPGNHDTNSVGYMFSGPQIIAVESMEDNDFDNVYLQLGYAQAISRDTASMSYVAQISPSVWCLLVDVNANGTSGTVLDDTFLWIEKQLSRAQAAGVTVIAVSHQPALTHNPLFTFGYQINNSQRLLELYARYNVQLSLCGHLHMQHVAKSGALTEVAASSLAVSPNQYGILRIADGKLLSYDMQPVNVSSWAQSTAQTNENLLDFAAYSAAFFDGTTRSQLSDMFAATDIPAADQQRMTDFAVQLNRAYFAGTRTDDMDLAAWNMWQERMPSSFFTYYMRSILMEDAQIMTHITFAN